MIRKLVICSLILILGCLSATYAQTNIARGKIATFNPPTNYSLCTDPDDPMQLTDGVFAEEGFWTDKMTVGWNYAAPYSLTIDLGSVQPISGIMYSTASRANAGVQWPSHIFILVSDDGKTYRYVDNLVEMDRVNGIPELFEAKEARHKYRTDSLKTHGRYVQLGITSSGSCVFIDEIEIYKGEDSFLQNTGKEIEVDSIGDFFKNRMVMAMVNERLSKDITDISQRIEASSIKPTDKKTLLARLGKYNEQINDLPVPDAKFKAILPLNDLHAKIYAINSPLLRLQKYPELKLWKKHRYDTLTPMETPLATKPALSIDALGSEFRADSFIATNTTDKVIEATLRIAGIGFNANWLDVSCVPWTDTSYLQPVSAALPSANKTSKGYAIKLPAGINTLLWFTADTSKIKPGAYQGSVVISYMNKSQKVPFSLRVSKINMPRPRLSLCMWDYTHAGGDRAMVQSNLDSARKMMKTHYVDSPWAQMDALPIGEDLSQSSFAIMDKWIKDWPNARHYLINGGFPRGDFQGAKIGSAEFFDKVGKWAKAVDDHLVSIGVDPRKLTVLIQDEPSTDETDEFIATYIKAIKSQGSRISIFQDPVWLHPEESNFPEAITLCDILCPNLSVYFSGGEKSRKFWEKIRDTDHDVWFYQCSGPVRTFSPTKYYRTMAWQAFKAGFVGIGFWSFGDLGGGNSSWNEYAISATIYAPAFVAPDGVTDSVHWQSVREGIQDYEYLALLSDAIKKSQNQRLKTEAQTLLNSVVADVTADTGSDYTWKSGASHATVDSSRIKVLRMLEKLQAPAKK